MIPCFFPMVPLMGLALNIQIAKASGTIYIRADGSIAPPTASILSLDNNTYTFTDDVADSIVVERDNIQVDGSGYTLQGIESGTGIDLSRRSNVTIKNMEIELFEYAIRLDDSSNNTISGNNITNSTNYGICLRCSSNNTLSENNTASYRHAFGYGTTCGVLLVDTSARAFIATTIILIATTVYFAKRKPRMEP